MIALMHGPFSIRLTSGSSRLEAKRSIVPLTQQHQSSLYFIFFLQQSTSSNKGRLLTRLLTIEFGFQIVGIARPPICGLISTPVKRLERRQSMEESDRAQSIVRYGGQKIFLSKLDVKIKICGRWDEEETTRCRAKQPSNSPFQVEIVNKDKSTTSLYWPVMAINI